MDVLLDNLPELLRGFRETLYLSGLAAALALSLGVLLAAMRVSPIPTLRWAGTGYVTVIRNTPLTLIFVFMLFGLPRLALGLEPFKAGALALGLYTAAFVCEAVRSGVNAVPVGQAEAARAIGFSFRRTLWFVVLPQAVRSTLPPLASILIALVKNSSIAEFFGTAEATKVFDDLSRRNPEALYWLFFGIALGYVILTLLIAGLFRFLESRLAVVR
ncbi:MAG TPA: amino acid ABC transporter permease [Mycobacteriales bacterium]|nr:amino acid ABC transporter permease [Mycobacteriales bacterium]